ncbi:hypothetical protein RND81_05G207600 [Saponaria officinalis]|uniref:Histidine kinase domain-containing protein n=1 Tax=Saponaria officinalis TaxID=3572 RepID=A0AAW1L2S4_SAPOF
MDSRNNIDAWSADEPLLKLHQFLDVVTAMAYFAIPLVFIYFIRLSPPLPHKTEFIYSGIVAIFCGAYYMTNLWKYYQYLDSEVTVILKGCSAAMLWLAILVLNFVFPDLFTLKRRELSLKNKVEELTSRQNVMLRQVNTRISFNKLIHEIRSTVDGKSILKSAVVGLGNILNLEECALWFPSQTNRTLCLSHCLRGTIPLGSTVPMSLPVLAEIFGSVEPVRISLTCPLVRATSICERCMSPDVVAVRVPLLHLPFTDYYNWLSTSATSYAVMVLIPPLGSITKFRPDELELVGAVAEQVAVALAHASAVEESVMARDQLRRQNSSLAITLRNMEMALCNSVLWRDGMFNQIFALQNIIPFLSSFLLDTTLTPEQRALVETVLKSSTLLDALMENVRDFVRLDDGSFELSTQIFDLSATINQVVDKIKPIAEVKKLSLAVSLAPNLPAYAVGDEEHLMQIILNILANAVKFTKEGNISITASIADPLSFRNWQPHRFRMVPSKNHFYLKVQIEDSGCGIEPQEIPRIFDRLVSRQRPPTSFVTCGLGLPICKRLVNIMEGNIWVESEGLDRGTTVTFIVKLRKSKRGPTSGLGTKSKSGVNV